ncbi:MAG: RHS repeat-associated core domain-containing protein [Pseudomonadota bacterium]
MKKIKSICFLLIIITISALANVFANIETDICETESANPFSLHSSYLGKESLAEYFTSNPDFWIHKWPDPVNLKNGNFYLGYEDIYIAGQLPLTFFRMYNSFDKKKSNLGYGWTHNYNIRVFENQYGYIEVTDATGFVSVFSASVANGNKNNILAEKLIEQAKKDDEKNNILRRETYYEKMLERMLSDKNFLKGYKTRYRNVSEKISQGTYYSLSSGFKYIIKSKDGYALTIYNGMKYDFNNKGYLIKISDPNGNYIELTYIKDNLQNIIDSKGRSIRLFYDTSNKLVKRITDPDNNDIEFRYDSDSNMLSAKDLNGNYTRYAYNNMHYITQITYPNKGIVNIEYDKIYTKKRIIKQTGPEKGMVSSYFYNGDSADNFYWRKITDASGNIYRYEYKNDENKTIINDPLGQKTEYYFSPICNKIIKMKQKDGQKTEYTLDKYGNKTKVKDALGNIALIDYNRVNFVTEIKDKTGSSIYEYDPKYRLISNTDTKGNQVSYRYHLNGLLSSIIDQKQKEKRLTYDKYGNLEAIMDASGNVTKFNHDALSRTTKLTDPQKGVFQFKYDKSGNIIAIKDALDNIATISYDSNGNITTYSVNNTSTMKYKYDLADRIIEVIDPYNNIHTFAYDSLGNVISYTNPAKQQTKYKYDPLSRVASISDPSEGLYFFKYNKSNQITSIRNPASQEWKYTYDLNGRLITKEDPYNNVTSYTYDLNSNLTSIKHPDGTTTTFIYDKFSRIVGQVLPSSEKQAYHYDAKGHIEKISSSLGNNLNFEYDSTGRIKKVTNELNQQITFSYDNNGNVKWISDVFGNREYFEYDLMDRLIKYINPDMGQYNFTYDTLGNIIKFKNPINSSYTFQYDLLNRLTSIEDENGSLAKYKYDKIGNREAFTNNNNVIKKFSFSILNNLTQVSTSSKNNKVFNYDNSGNIITAKNNSESIKYDYGVKGDLDKISYEKLNKSLLFTYDSQKQNTAFKFDNLETTYKYRQDKALMQLGLTNLKNVSFLYDTKNRMSEIIYPEKVKLEYSYTKNHELRKKVLKNKNGKVLASVEYIYDSLGNVLSYITDDNVYEYQYDKSYRITKVKDKSNSVISYDYNKNSDRTSYKRKNIEIPYKYNRLSQLYQIGSVKYAFDKNGKLIKSLSKNKRIEYKYNDDDYLSEVILNAKKVISFEYDPWGRLYSATQGNDKTYYIYNGINLIARLNKSYQILDYYFYDQKMDLIAIWKDNTIFYPLTDKNNSLIALYNSKTEEVSKREYGPFGKINSETMQDFGISYQGHLYFKDIGLYYMKNRFYNPIMGRFITPDPIGLAGGMNEYSFCRNNPIRYAEPLGLFSISNPEVTKIGSRLNMGFIDTGIYSSIFPSLPVFPKPSLSYGYNYSIGESLTSNPIYKNVNSIRSSDSARGGGGRFGKSARGNLNELAQVALSSYFNDLKLYASLKDPTNSIINRFGSSSLTNDITFGKLIGASFRSPFSYAQSIGKWLWKEQTPILSILYPKKDNPLFLTPNASYLDFLIFPNENAVLNFAKTQKFQKATSTLPNQVSDTFNIPQITTFLSNPTVSGEKTLSGEKTVSGEETSSGSETVSGSETSAPNDNSLDSTCGF